MDPFAKHTVEDFLASVAARRSAPGGGAVAAVTVAAAAGLVAMCARYSSAEGAAAHAGQADAERTAVLQLADADAAAYGEVLAALQAPETDPGHAQRVRAALQGAADVPLQMAEAGARIARTGAAVAAGGNPNLVGDVRAAVVLAEAGARAAAELVRINVEFGDLDTALADAAASAVEQAAAAARPVLRAP